jgi:hypothetical protein
VFLNPKKYAPQAAKTKFVVSIIKNMLCIFYNLFFESKLLQYYTTLVAIAPFIGSNPIKQKNSSYYFKQILTIK